MRRLLLILISLIFVAGSCNQSQPESKLPVNEVYITPPPFVGPPIPSAPIVKDPAKQKQYIVFAFDGSKSLDMWQESLDFAQQMKLDGKPIHFTYFISGVYLITYKNQQLYQSPEPGGSKIGFGDSQSDVIKRINYINQAVADGHEIGSHLNGHFSGVKWTKQQWQSEFDQFRSLVDNVNVNNSIDPSVAKLNISSQDIVGMRAPNLGYNKDFWPMLKTYGYEYDGSTIGTEGQWPAERADGIWEFPISSIKFAGTKDFLLSMDYNFYIKQTQGRDLLKAGTSQWQIALDQVYNSYLDYFAYNYQTKAPIFIAHHFSKWNDGLYWEAMKKFAEEECGKPEVACVSDKELMEELQAM